MSFWKSATAMEELAAIEEKWAKVNPSYIQEVQFIKDYAIYIDSEIESLSEMQPKCWLLKENYDKVFSEYKAKVEQVSYGNQRATRVLDNCSQAKSRIENLHYDIAFLNELRAKNIEFLNEWQKEDFARAIKRLEDLKTNFEQLGNEKLENQEQLSEKFKENIPIIEQLLYPTHKWIPLEKREVTTRAAWNPPEGSSMEPRKAEVHTFVSRSKCEKCSLVTERPTDQLDS